MHIAFDEAERWELADLPHPQRADGTLDDEFFFQLLPVAIREIGAPPTPPLSKMESSPLLRPLSLPRARTCPTPWLPSLAGLALGLGLSLAGGALDTMSPFYAAGNTTVSARAGEELQQKLREA